MLGYTFLHDSWLIFQLKVIFLPPLSIRSQLIFTKVLYFIISAPLESPKTNISIKSYESLKSTNLFEAKYRDPYYTDSAHFSRLKYKKNILSVQSKFARTSRHPLVRFSRWKIQEWFKFQDKNLISTVNLIYVVF